MISSVLVTEGDTEHESGKCSLEHNMRVFFATKVESVSLGMRKGLFRSSEGWAHNILEVS